MAKKRRPQRAQNYGLDPIAVPEMGAAVDYSMAERVDGHKGTAVSDAGRKRRSHTTPLHLSDLDYFIGQPLFSLKDGAEANDNAWERNHAIEGYEKLFDGFVRRINAGVINFNSTTTGASGAFPFGGIGRSGNLRPAGFYAADYCAWPKASIIKKL